MSLKQGVSGKDRHMNYRARVVAGSIVIFLIAFLLYVPVLQNDFVNWDDDICIYENTHIRSLDLKSLQWMLTAFHAGNWHPLTWLSHAAVYKLWGLNPSMHHLINVILHGLNTVLVFLLVIQLMFLWRTNDCTIPPASRKIAPVAQAFLVGGITALLLGLHPLHVESVAWVTERKGLLCTFFMLLTFLSYLTYASLAHGKRRLLWFGISLLLFICALMSKPLAMTLPLVLLLLDYYPLRRTGWDSRTGFILFLEKIPFFILSLASGAVTIAAQKSAGALQSLQQFDLTAQLLNALTALATYLGKIIWPDSLVPFYPFSAHLFNMRSLVSGLVVLGMSLCSLVLGRRGKPLLLIAWLYYVITLLPVLGIIRIGSHAAADRFTYLPSLSMYLLIAIGVSWLWKNFSSKRCKGLTRVMLVVCICITMLFLCRRTVQQIGVWKNSEVLWEYVIEFFPNSFAIAYNNLGEAYLDQGRLDEAILEYRKAIAINPAYFEAKTNLGIVYAKKGMVDEAIAEYREAITINPTYAKAHGNLGAEYIRKEMFENAIVACKRAITLRPNYAKAYFNLGAAYGNKGMMDEAIASFIKAITIKPHYAKAQYNLGVAYYSREQFKLAMVHFDEARRLGYSIRPEFLEFLKSYR